MNCFNIFPIVFIDLRKRYSFILDSSNQTLFGHSVPKHMELNIYIHIYIYIFFLVFKSRAFFA